MRYIFFPLLVIITINCFSNSDKDTIIFYQINYISKTNIPDTVFYKVGINDYFSDVDSFIKKNTLNASVEKNINDTISKFKKIKKRNFIDYYYYTWISSYTWYDGILFDNILYSLFSKNKLVIIKNSKNYRYNDVSITIENYSIHTENCGEDWCIYDKNVLITKIGKTRNGNYYQIR